MNEQEINSTEAATAEEVRELLELVRSRLLAQDDGKANVGDYIRLLQLYREMEGERPRQIEVRWIEPSSAE
jgi:hypothetical protein